MNEVQQIADLKEDNAILQAWLDRAHEALDKAGVPADRYHCDDELIVFSLVERINMLVQQRDLTQCPQVSVRHNVDA